MSFPNNVPPSGAQTGTQTVTLGQYFQQPVNNLYPSYINVEQEYYLDVDSNEAVNEYQFDGKHTSSPVTQLNFQPLTSTGFANLTDTGNIQHFFPGSCLFYGRTVFEHSLQYNKMTRLTYPQIVSEFSRALTNANISDKDAMNLWEIAYKYANCLTTGRFIVIPDLDISNGILSNPLKSEQLTLFWIRMEQQLSGLRTPYAIGKDQRQLKFEVSQNLYQVLLGNSLGFNGSDAAYNDLKNNKFTQWRGLSNVRQQWYFQKPVAENTFTATVNAKFNGTSDDININKVMDYSFVGDIAGFLFANDSMIHYTSPKEAINEWAIADKTTISKGWMWMNDHGIVPTHQPWCWLVLTKAPTFQDYQNAYTFVTSLQPSLMGLYVKNHAQQVAETTTVSNHTSTYDKMGWSDFTTLRTLAWDQATNTYKLGQGTLTSGLQDGTKYDWIKKAQENIYDYLFGSNSLFFVNDPNTALSSGRMLELYSERELVETAPVSLSAKTDRTNI